MRATIEHTGETLDVGTLDELYSEVSRRLSVSGPRALTARTETGAEVHSSLYPGDSYIRDGAGRTRWSDRADRI